MATQFRNEQEIYREVAAYDREPSVSAVLVRTPFAEFAQDITREAHEIRQRYAEILAQGEDDEDD